MAEEKGVDIDEREAENSEENPEKTEQKQAKKITQKTAEDAVKEQVKQLNKKMDELRTLEESITQKLNDYKKFEEKLLSEGRSFAGSRTKTADEEAIEAANSLFHGTGLNPFDQKKQMRLD